MLLCWLGAVTMAAEDLRFEHITVREGLSQNSVHAILQDAYGYLWFGTQDGLNRYDGYNFNVYRQQTADNAMAGVTGNSGLTSSTIWALFEDRENVLWIGTATGLNRFLRDTDTFIHYRHLPDDQTSLSHQTVRAIVDDEQGNLWVGTSRGGLNRLDRDTGVFTHFRHNPADPHSISSDRISSIVEIGGELWIGTEDAGINHFDPASGIFTRYRHNPLSIHSLSSDQITYLLVDSQNLLWIATEDGGLNSLDMQSGQFAHFLSDPANPGNISSNTLRTLYEDSLGRFWVGHYQSGGLDVFDRENGVFRQYSRLPGVVESLNDDHVLSIYEDRSGVLWVGTHVGGLNKYDRKRERFRHYQNDWRNENTLSNDIIRSFYKHGQLLYIGTEGGLNVLDQRTGQFTHFIHNPNQVDGIPHNIIRGMDMDEHGYLWLATHGGLSRFDPANATFTNYLHDPADPYSISSDTVWRVYVDSLGSVWAGARDQLNRLDVQTGRFERFAHDPADPYSLSGDRIMAIYEDSRGAMWFSTVTTGVNRFDRDTGRFTNYTHQLNNPNSLSDSFVFSITEDKGGVMWFGTRGGLNRFDPVTEIFKHFTEADGLGNDVIYGMLIDDANDFWLSTNRGLSRFNPVTLTFSNFGPHDGLQGEEFNNGAYYQSVDGEMYFGGVNGFNVFRPETIRESNYHPPIVITRFSVLNEDRMIGTPFSGSHEIELSHWENYLAFEFAALDFSAPEKNQYAYRLEGFDSQWVDAGDRRYASYTNLNPGKYLFRVRGTNSDGILSTNLASVPLYISPAFWQTAWFRLSILLAGVLLLLVLYKYKTISVHRRNSELEALVAERTAMLKSINENLQSEVIQRQKAEEEIRKIAYHDHLTGLPNRRLFRSLCERALADAQRGKKTFALMFLDVNLFKEINDRWGHDAGDAVLVAMAERIRRVVRASDIVSRRGGDEFVLLLADIGSHGFAARVADKLIGAIVEPIVIQPLSDTEATRQVSVGASIGISLFPEHGVSLEALLSKADNAMYKAKKTGRSSYCFHGGGQ